MRAVRTERVASTSIVVCTVMIILRFGLQLWHVWRRSLESEPVMKRSSHSWLMSEDQTIGFSRPCCMLQAKLRRKRK